MITLQKIMIFLFCALALAPALSVAQEEWSSPESAQMYRQAQEYMALKNYKEAVSIYKRAIVADPDNNVLYIALGRALHMDGNDAEAEKTLNSIRGGGTQSADLLELQAECLAAQGEMKEARTVIKLAISNFPDSGFLYEEAGRIGEQDHKDKDALLYRISGMEHAPGYAFCYYAAANIYLHTDDVLWGLMYGETYLCMRHDTANDETLKKLLYEGYKKLSEKFTPTEAMQYGKVKNTTAATGFKESVSATYEALAPVMSDGNSAENLTMLRTRFLIDWFPANDQKYPCSLFRYLDGLVRNGYFDVYNEWLFGRAENVTEYNAWNTFHEGGITRFLQWKNNHPMVPVKSDFYNDKSTKAVQ